MSRPSSQSVQPYRSVLVLEPVSSLRNIVTGFLRLCRIPDIITCSSPVEAIRIFRAQEVDLVISGSTHKVGYALALALRLGKDSPNRTVPMMLLEKSPSKKTVLGARNSGINTVLAFPFSAAVLHRRIEALHRVPVEMIYAGSYVGPDRRHLAAANPGGPERRKGAVPEKPNYVLSVSDILRSFLSTDTSASGKPERLNGRGCRACDLEPGQQLEEACITTAGVVVVATKGVLTERSIQRIVDMVASGDLADRFVVAI
jgi:CheY-like chemotaxis protein